MLLTCQGLDWHGDQMQRPSWDTYFIQMASLVSTRGTCDRKRVGAVLVNEHKRLVSTGYNGTPKGVPHCDDEGVGHTLAEIDGRQSCIATLHAESNALDDAGRNARGGTIYTTVIPCFDCAKRIVNAGVVRVVYSEYYESRKTTLVVEYFERVGIPLVHLEPNMEDYACTSCDATIPPPTCDKCGSYQ